MKNTFIQTLILAFSMLVIPLFSITGKAAQDNVLPTGENIGDIIYEPLNANTDFNNFKVLKDGKVTSVSAKDYVFGVVAAEMPALYHEEALKAQAVAAYTFACYKKNTSQNAEYDIVADPETAQCFITREEAAEKWGEKSTEYSEKIKKCVDEVLGQMLVYEKAPIFAAYHAISAGSTNACADVWGKDIPYLKSTDSMGDKLANGYLSEATFTADEIAEKLKGIAEASGEAQNYFGDAETTDNGYVKTIMFCGKKVSGSEISKALGLRSSHFEVTFVDGNFNFSVKGYGHGVGMSQNGANYMAQQGSDYKEILLHYYKGAVLQKN